MLLPLAKHAMQIRSNYVGSRGRANHGVVVGSREEESRLARGLNEQTAAATADRTQITE